jgi:CBS domain-containing protein
VKVADLLKSKGQTVITTTPDEALAVALGRLIEHKIGALVVCDDVKIVGIISERDVLQLIYHDRNALDTKKVKDCMTTNLIVAIPDDDLNYVMGIMTQNRIRHLPIVTKQGIVGIVSIGDIVKHKLQEVEIVNRYLEEYIYGRM